LKLAALLSVLGVAGVGAFAAFGAPPVPSPTISSKPANPTNLTGATFVFSASGATGYQCAFDTSTFTACSSPKSYTGLAAGSHSFQVRALKGSAVSSAVSYAWTIDLTAPTLTSIARVGASPTNAASVAWTVTFSEPVGSVVQARFGLVASGVSGAAITGFSGSGATYTVTASSGSGSGTLGLNLTSKGTGATEIKDPAGNVLSNTVPVIGAAYTFDRTAPPAPSITSGPTGTANPPSASFSFTDTEPSVSFLCKLDSGSYVACTSPKVYSGLGDGSHTFSVTAKDAAGNISAAATRTWSVDATGPAAPLIVGPNNKSPSTAATFTLTNRTGEPVTYQCSMDSGPYLACVSPKTYTLLTAGTHVFRVRALDAAGNIGPFDAWTWSIAALSSGGVPFTISGNGSSTLYPGGPAAHMDLVLSNPNSVTIYITSLAVELSISASHPGPNPCVNADFDLSNLQFSGGYPINLPPGTKTLSQLGYTQAQMPGISMFNRPLNQDACKNATLNFAYSGSAQS
jgi:hypothetical protein